MDNRTRHYDPATTLPTSTTHPYARLFIEIILSAALDIDADGDNASSAREFLSDPIVAAMAEDLDIPVSATVLTTPAQTRAAIQSTHMQRAKQIAAMNASKNLFDAFAFDPEKNLGYDL